MSRGITGLTKRERQIVHMLAIQGLDPAEAARQLDISLKTLKTHMSHVYCRLGIQADHKGKLIYVVRWVWGDPRVRRAVSA